MRSVGHGIEQTCKVLADYGINFTARGYRAARSRPCSKRGVMDRQIINILEGLRTPDEKGKTRPEGLYGARKMWRHLPA